MASMIFKAVSWQLRVFSEGKRRIDLDLLPLETGLVECIGVEGGQRCFIGDPEANSSKKLVDRLKGREQEAPHIRGISCTIREDLKVPFLAEVVQKELDVADEPGRELSEPWGLVDLSAGDLTLRTSTRTIDELIRQNGVGQRIYYIEVDLDGLERTTAANSEDGLVKYLWQDQLKGAYDRGSRVNHYGVHYHASEIYSDTVAPESQSTNKDPESSGPLLEKLVSESKRTSWFVQMLCVLVLVVIALIWNR